MQEEKHYDYRGKSKLISEVFDFEIIVSNSELAFWEYRKILYRAIGDKFNYDYNENVDIGKSPIQLFAEKRISELNNNRNNIIFLTNYSERQGSFIITFSIFVFTTVMNYGQLRDSLDKLKYDFEYVFSNNISSNTTVDARYKVKPNKVFRKIEKNITRNIINQFQAELKKIKLIAFSTSITAICLSLFAIFQSENNQNKNPEINKDDLKKEIQKEIEEKETKDKIDLIYKILKDTKIDSVRIK